MSTQHPHSRLITAAAREVLRPLGLVQQGRSRLWYADHDWYLINVEFQPSSFTRGSFVNVGVQWLWNVADQRVFHFGHRLWWKDGDFYEYESDEQFAPLARKLAIRAADRVAYYRELFPTVAAAAEALNDDARWVGLEHRSHNPEPRDQGIAAGLAGDAETARRRFRERIAAYEGDLAADEIFGDWEHREAARVRRLDELLDDPERFRAEIDGDVRRTREVLRL
jgi:hypothetical protein